MDCYWKLIHNLLQLLATDGHRMAICRLVNHLNHPHHRFLIPRKGIQEILKILNTITDDEVLLSAGKSHLNWSLKITPF